MTKKFKKIILETADEKFKKAEVIISNISISDKQRERYVIKAKHARNVIGLNLTEVTADAEYRGITVQDVISESRLILEPMAIGKNMTIDDFALLIVEKNKAWRYAIDKFSSYVEALKSKAFDYLKAKDFVNVRRVINASKEVGVTEEELSIVEKFALIETQTLAILNFSE